MIFFRLNPFLCRVTLAVLAAGIAIGSARAADQFAALATKLAPAVVNISTSQTVKGRGNADAEPGNNGQATPFDRFFKDFVEPGDGDHGTSSRKAKALGSGFIIDPSGLVVTNNHVIADADEITVVLQNNTELKAELVGRDAETDVALLRVKPDHPLPSVKFGSSEAVKVGDWVMAVGNPYGLGGTVTTGILSARARQISNGGPYDSFLQTDAAINRGNSGGPLFNGNGEVIGINSAIISPSGGSIGLGFAIPAELADHVISAIKKYGRVRRGYLGVRIESLTDDTASIFGLAKPAGALVAGVPADSPAKKAGVEPGDVIVSFNGKSVSDVTQLQRLVDDAPINEAFPLGVWRQKAMKIIPVNLPEAVENDEPAPPAANTPKGKTGL